MAQVLDVAPLTVISSISTVIPSSLSTSLCLQPSIYLPSVHQFTTHIVGSSELIASGFIPSLCWLHVLKETEAQGEYQGGHVR